MAFLPPNQEDKDAPQGTTSSGSQQSTAEEPPETSAGSAGDGGGTGIPGAGPSSGTPTQFGSSSSKLGDYLTANAPQIKQQADKVAGNLNQQFGQIQNDINTGISNFGQQVQQGYTQGNKALVAQAATDPTKFVQDPNNISAFHQQLNNQYTGPQNFESTTPYNNVQQEVTGAVNQAKTLGSQSGLSDYFASTNKNPTRASNTLDSLLVSGNPEAQQTVSATANQFNGLTDQFGNAVTGADANVKAAQDAAKASSDYAHSQLGDMVTGFNTGLNNELNQAQTQNNTYNTNVDALRSALQSGDLSKAKGVDSGLLNYLNNVINPWFAQNGSGYKPTYNYANALPNNINAQAPTLAGVASSNDYNTLAALNQLSGDPITSLLSADTANQAGTYSIPTMQPVNNQLIAQDILNGANAPETNSIHVGAQPYQQYLSDLQALNNYLNNGQNAFGNQPGLSKDPYHLVPAIQSQLGV